MAQSGRGNEQFSDFEDIQQESQGVKIELLDSDAEDDNGASTSSKKSR